MLLEWVWAGPLPILCRDVSASCGRGAHALRCSVSFLEGRLPLGKVRVWLVGQCGVGDVLRKEEKSAP